MEKRTPYRIVVIILTAAMLWFPGYRLFGGERTDKTNSGSTVTSSGGSQKTGEQVFMDNCSRCHKPPMTISPRITGTIVMHMRVRAKLSRQDEQALLRYLAP
jgi:hypothetical protein